MTTPAAPIREMRRTAIENASAIAAAREDVSIAQVKEYTAYFLSVMESGCPAREAEVVPMLKGVVS